MSHPYEYVAYIDEAGDPGLKRVKPKHPNGSSEWLIVSAVVVSREHEPEIVPWLRAIRAGLKNHQRPGIHFKDLNPAKRRFACEGLAKLPVRIFVVASNKKNMEGYDNPFAARVSMDANWFYCWLTRILLERVTHFVHHHSTSHYGAPRKVKLEYSIRGGLSYSQLKAYFELLKMKSTGGDLKLPLGDLYWSTVTRDLVELHAHQNRAGLQFSDVAASAFFKACDRYDTGACDPEFAKLLAPRMARHNDKISGQVSGYGLKLMPGWRQARLLPEQGEVFRFYGYPSQWWDPASFAPKAESPASIWC